MKSYTDIEQSKVLAKILPLESADMRYYEYPSHINRTPIVGYIEGITDGIPCWSLAALLDILPTKLQIVLAINDFQGDRKEKYFIGSVEHDKYNCYADNPVDACVEVIIKLHELKKL